MRMSEYFSYLFYFGFSILCLILCWAPWVEALADSYLNTGSFYSTFLPEHRPLHTCLPLSRHQTSRNAAYSAKDEPLVSASQTIPMASEFRFSTSQGTPATWRITASAISRGSLRLERVRVMSIVRAEKRRSSV